MKKLLIRGMALLLTGIMLLGGAGCAAITEQLDGIFKENTESPDQDRQNEPEIEMPARNKETYTFLIMTEAVEEAVLDHVMLVSFNTAAPSISILQLPTDLYLHISEQSVEGLFQKRYEKAVKEGHTPKESAAAASEAIVDVLSNGFYTPIDYYINFSSSQLTSLINTLGGVKMNVPFAMGSLKAGSQTLSGSQAMQFLSYDRFSSMPQDYLDARKILTAAVYNQARATVESEILSLFVMELRSAITTNIPSDGGEDIFFVRKWLQTTPENFKITNLSTQVVYVSSTACRVLLKGNSLQQMNEVLAIYEEDLTEAQFDPRYVFVDYSSDVAKAVYHSSAALPATYTAKALNDGTLVLKK